MDTETFKTVCEAIWGPSWRGVAAEGLGVSPRTVNRWHRGINNIPEGIATELAGICRKRAKKLTACADSLTKKPR